MGWFDKTETPFNGGEWMNKMKLQNTNVGSDTVVSPGLLTTNGVFDVDKFRAQNLIKGTPYSNIQSTGAGGGSMFDSFLTKTDPETGMTKQGWGNFGLSALQAGAGYYLGSKQLGLAEDQFAEAKRQFGKNFGAQLQSYNTNIRDRQDRRYSGAGGGTVAENPYAQTDEYMQKNRMV